MEILGYIGAIIMGLSLGLIGGGGSILTVPILVYLFSVDMVTATAYSLFLVGVTSVVGSISHMRMGNIHWRTAIVFGIPSLLAVYAAQAWVLPAIPDPVMHVLGTSISKSLILLMVFAVLMVLASISMIRKPRTTGSSDAVDDQHRTFNYPLILGEGVAVGMITGLVGAGGGFLIIPALVLLAKLPMKQAVGTSLLIIAGKSLFGFTGAAQRMSNIDWNFLLLFSVVAIIGIIAGSLLSKRIPNERLKPAFGWFVLAMGVYIIGRELTHLS
jgi:hypothetical protein